TQVKVYEFSMARYQAEMVAYKTVQKETRNLQKKEEKMLQQIREIELRKLELDLEKIAAQRKDNKKDKVKSMRVHESNACQVFNKEVYKEMTHDTWYECYFAKHIIPYCRDQKEIAYNLRTKWVSRECWNEVKGEFDMDDLDQ